MGKVFVTGATGFVGRNLIEHFGDIYWFERGMDPQVVQDVKPDIIYHLAGEIKTETLMFESNIKLTYDLLRFSGDTPFVYVGSSSEYGRRPDLKISEKCGLNPTNLYEATKGCGSLLCKAFAANGRRVMVARPFSLYGPNDHYNRFFSVVYKAFKYDSPLSVWNGSHDWIYIDDFIRGLLVLGEKGEAGDVVNFGTGVSSSNREVVYMFQKVLNYSKPFNIVNSYLKPYDCDNWVCDTTYAKEKYGFECDYDLESGIRDYLFKKTGLRYQLQE